MIEENSYSYFINLIEESNDQWLCADVKKDFRGEDFVLWERVCCDGSFPIMKCEGILQHSAKKVYNFMLNADLETQKEWDDSLVDCKVIRDISPNSQLIHFIYSAPFPVKSRDFCFQRFLKDEINSSLGNQRYAILGTSVEDDELPVRSKYTRGDILIGGYLIEELTGETCRIISVTCVDPKGWIPNFVINLTKTRPLDKLLKFSQNIS